MKHTIIGWGLAGAMVAWELYFTERAFQVIHLDKTKSSRVAAGIVNPIVFKRLTMGWQADKLMPFAAQVYAKIEEELNVKFIRPMSIFRILSNIEEENNWAVKMGDDQIGKYLSFVRKDSLPNKQQFDMPFGAGKVNTFGHMDTNLFLDESRLFFEQKGMKFKDELFDYQSIPADKKCEYFFCEGAEIVQNPYFKQVAMRPTHGDLLVIKTEEELTENVLNKNMFLLPLGNCLYKVGATYNWKKREPEPTAEGKEELLAKLDAWTDFKYEIVDHQAGLRPTIADRRPVLGTHPDVENIHLLNGLGTKGVLIGPFYANQLIAAVFHQQEIDSEVSLTRFFS
jgi:glycine oxidase